MAIAFLDLAASIPTKASVYSTMACPPCAEDRLGPPEQPSSRIVGRATSSAAERTYGHTVQTLSLQEMFVLCQQHGFEVDNTVEQPASLQDGEIGIVTELNAAV